MRVYELAKELGVTSGDVLRAAAQAGFEAETAISKIFDADIAPLTEALKGVDRAALAAKRDAKRAKSADAAAKRKIDGDEALKVHLEKAKAAHASRKPGLKKPEPAAGEKEAAAAGGEPETGIATEPIGRKPETASPTPAKTEPRTAKAEPKAQAVKFGTVGLTNAGFKPISRPKAPVGGITISVNATPKPKAPKIQVGVADSPKGGKNAAGRDRDRRDRENAKGFDRSKGGKTAEIQTAGRINVNEESREISIRGAVVVKDLAVKLGIKPNRLIADLMMLKILASINQRVEPDVATKVAEKYGFKVVVEKARDKAAAKPVLKAIDADDLIPEDPPETLKPRAPVITFLGHVDHGKTTLMDYIRKEHVAAGEAGGITQQISAYQVDVAGKKITFLDTPGHAAFSSMRARGAQITDIAVLIIAADDGIMPQTEECIRVARQAGVQIMVAITKCDKPTANVDRVKQQLQKAGLTPEDWGGDIICCPVSGTTGEGVDSLLENILVQAEVLELMANPNRRANGYVIESELQQGMGPCATLLVTGGTLKVGDAILIGEHFGKVRALIDDHGRRIKEAPPATPVKCTGLSGVPEAGSDFRVMLDEKRARTLAEQTAQEKKQEALANSKAATLDMLMSRMAAEGKKELNVVVKSDTQGSLEAIVQALEAIKSEKVGLNIIGTGTGNVSLTDVKSAAAGKAVVVGFDVGIDSGVQSQARHDGVRINCFRIIYELLDHVKQCMLDLLPPEYKEVVRGHATIKAIYDIGKLGKIAGSQMEDGVLVAKELFRIFRGREEIWSGKVQTLRHYKDEVKEVTTPQECGVCFQDFEGFKEGDTIECYQMEELPRSL